MSPRQLRIPRERCHLRYSVWMGIRFPMPRAATTSDPFNAIAEPRRATSSHCSPHERPGDGIADALEMDSVRVQHLRGGC